jgi:hypothetical protein
MVGLSTASFVGVPPEDNPVLARLPRDYTDFLQSINGCVVFGGGLHIRGASTNQTDIRQDVSGREKTVSQGCIRK